MVGKRKFDSDDDTNSPVSAKQLKLVPFPSYMDRNVDVDMDMDTGSDDASSPGFYSRSANVSTSSSTSSAPSSPSLLMAPSLSRVDSSSAKPPVGLVGCSVLGNAFQHHGNCTQIPKLRMACATGNGRSRSMWSHCEQCGAIAMVDLD